jgi:glycosyltransferase involved in cell wall biosynthesis
LIVTLLGKRDRPTDAVEDYCRLLGAEFERRGIASALVRVGWDEAGWLRGLRELWRAAAAWRGDWVLVQYTALMWSRRGFSLPFIAVLAVLRLRKVRVALVFHDAASYAGKRLVDRARRTCQIAVMKSAYWLAHISIVTVPVREISWLAPRAARAAFIPVGSNVPAAVRPRARARLDKRQKTVAGFSFSSAHREQVLDFALAARSAAAHLGTIRLLMLGRTMDGAEARIRGALEGSTAQVANHGRVPSSQVAQELATADVLLFTRGLLSTNRGSAIAAIACGLPVVAYGQPEPDSPLSEAGILFVPYGDREALSRALVKVLSDDDLWTHLHERNLHAYQKYFSWSSVARQFLDALDMSDPPAAQIA